MRVQITFLPLTLSLAPSSGKRRINRISADIKKKLYKYAFKDCTPISSLNLLLLEIQAPSDTTSISQNNLKHYLNTQIYLYHLSQHLIKPSRFCLNPNEIQIRVQLLLSVLNMNNKRSKPTSICARRGVSEQENVKQQSQSWMLPTSFHTDSPSSVK